MKTPAACESATKWLRANKVSLAPLTGQDFAALRAFAHGLELYGYSDDSGREHALLVMRHAALAMQPKCRTIACASIPWFLDWSDRDTLWPKIMGQAAEIVEGGAR